MKRAVLGSFIVAAVLMLASCGSGLGVSSSPSDSPSPTLTSASPSPSLTPTVLTEAELLTQWLQDVKPIRQRYIALEKKLDHVIWEDADLDSINSTWPPAGRKVRTLIKQYKGIVLDLQSVDTPDSMKPAIADLVEGLRIERTAYATIAGYLVRKVDWSEHSANDNRLHRLWDHMWVHFDAWSNAADAEATRLGVTIPWNWTS